RGTADKPGDRFASMDALVAALAPRRRSRAWLALPIAAALVVALAGGSVETVTHFVERPIVRPVLRVIAGGDEGSEPQPVPTADEDVGVEPGVAMDEPAAIVAARASLASRSRELAGDDDDVVIVPVVHRGSSRTHELAAIPAAPSVVPDCDD